MKRLFIIIVLLYAMPVSATSYFMSTSGNDANAGTSSGVPWASPNHAVNCGDTITAAAGTYTAAHMSSWGTVTCAGNNNVAWVQCVTFDACKVTGTGVNAVTMSASYWGIQGFEATSSNRACFYVTPPNTSTNIHHIIIANSIANGCANNGIAASNNGAASFDYVVFIGDIAYNAATGSTFCATGITWYQPVAHDALAGTHLYAAGNFSYDNVDPATCSGHAPTDGEGVLVDHMDGSGGGPAGPFAGQVVVQNNILLYNGLSGLGVGANSAGSSHANVYLKYNTTYGNGGGGSINQSICAEIWTSSAQNVTVTNNLSQATQATACTAHTYYVLEVFAGFSSESWTTNYGYSAAGNNTGILGGGSFSSFGSTNTFGTSPAFSNPTNPGAPSCGSAASVPACMSTVISNFTPTTSGSTAYGYQVPLGFSITDPLFPSWLCTVTLPAGLVTRGCGAPPTLGTSVGATVGVAGKTSVQ